MNTVGDINECIQVNVDEIRTIEIEDSHRARAPLPPRNAIAVPTVIARNPDRQCSQKRSSPKIIYNTYM